LTSSAVQPQPPQGGRGGRRGAGQRGGRGGQRASPASKKEAGGSLTLPRAITSKLEAYLARVDEVKKALPEERRSAFKPKSVPELQELYSAYERERAEWLAKQKAIKPPVSEPQPPPIEEEAEGSDPEVSEDKDPPGSQGGTVITSPPNPQHKGEKISPPPLVKTGTAPPPVEKSTGGKGGPPTTTKIG
jgi:hypothetical protein